MVDEIYTEGIIIIVIVRVIVVYDDDDIIIKLTAKRIRNSLHCSSRPIVNGKWFWKNRELQLRMVRHTTLCVDTTRNVQCQMEKCVV